MGTFTTKLKLGGRAFGVHGGLDPYIEELTVGQIRVIETLPSIKRFRSDPCYLEEYMCIETGVGTGTVWEYGRNIFPQSPKLRPELLRINRPHTNSELRAITKMSGTYARWRWI